MRKIFLTLCMASLFLACAKTNRQIDYTSPCACYEIEKITQFRG